LDGEEAVWVKHILIKADSTATEEEKKNAEIKAQGILDSLKKGEDFAKLARENSDDPGSAQYGGDYVFGKGKMVAEFEKEAFSLSPGQVSGLVETGFGYHIIKVEEKYAKDQPASLRCAKEYWEYGLNHVISQSYQQKLDEWKKDTKYDVKITNQGAYDSIK
jgi:parvulin-like peptidyl-prolyl isomerase